MQVSYGGNLNTINTFQRDFLIRRDNAVLIGLLRLIACKNAYLTRNTLGRTTSHRETLQISAYVARMLAIFYLQRYGTEHDTPGRSFGPAAYAASMSSSTAITSCGPSCGHVPSCGRAFWPCVPR